MEKKRKLLVVLILAVMLAGGWHFSAKLVQSPENPFSFNSVAFHLKYLFQSLFFAMAGCTIVLVLRIRHIRIADPLYLCLKLLCLASVLVFWVAYFLPFGWTVWKVWVFKNMWVFVIPGFLFSIIEKKVDVV